MPHPILFYATLIVWFLASPIGKGQRGLIVAPPKAGKTMAYEKGGVFVCSSHLSAFTPKDGGKRVNGPATEGLTQIILEIDEEDNIWAVGALGPSKFHDYLDAFKPEFKKYYGGKRKGKKLVKVEAKVVTLSNFSKDLIQY